MPKHKLIPPLPETSESEYERFKRLAASILAVPRSKVVQEQAKLEAEKTEIENKAAYGGQRMRKLG